MGICLVDSAMVTWNIISYFISYCATEGRDTLNLLSRLAGLSLHNIVQSTYLYCCQLRAQVCPVWQPFVRVYAILSYVFALPNPPH